MHRFTLLLSAQNAAFIRSGYALRNVLLFGLVLMGHLFGCLPLSPQNETTRPAASTARDAGETWDDGGWVSDAAGLDAMGASVDASAPMSIMDAAAGEPQDGGLINTTTDAASQPALDGGAGPAQTEDAGPTTRTSDSGPICPDVICALACPGGLEEDSNGCPLCICAAESDVRDGGSCPPVLCDLYCETGFRRDENGCEICGCREATCEGTRCPDNTHCEIRPANSTRPEMALCVEDENPVCDLVCEEGQHCELQQVICIQAPCPPLDTCVIDEELNGPHPIDCRELICPPETQCGTTPSGALACVPRIGCEFFLCRDNMICRMTLAEDGEGEIPICVIDPNATCDLTCESGNRCEIVETSCGADICPPLDQCIPDEPGLSCANLICVEGHICEMRTNEAGEVAPICVPEGSPCDSITCDVGWRCEEIVLDGQPTGRCVHAPPPPRCDLLCPPEVVCQLRQAPCPEAECPLVPECVAQLLLSPLPGSCESIRCAAGHRCVPGPLRAGLPTSYCVSIYADYCASDGDCDEVACHAETLCLPPPSATPNQPAPELCYGLCLGETTFCESAVDCGPYMACDLEACVPSSCNGDVCTSDCRSICVQKDQVDCESPRYDCLQLTTE